MPVVIVSALSAAFTVLGFIPSTIQALGASTEQLGVLSTSAEQLLTTLNTEFTESRLSPEKCVKPLADLETLLRDIHRFVENEKESGFLRLLLQKDSRVLECSSAPGSAVLSCGAPHSQLAHLIPFRSQGICSQPIPYPPLSTRQIANFRITLPPPTMSILAVSLLAPAPAPETATLPVNADAEAIPACSTRSRAQNWGNIQFHARLCARPAPALETHASPQDTGESSASRLGDSRGPCEMGTATTTGGSPCIGTAGIGIDPKIFALTHGPSTDLGTPGSPSASLRIVPPVIGDVVACRSPVRVLLLLVSFFSLLLAGIFSSPRMTQSLPPGAAILVLTYRPCSDEIKSLRHPLQVMNVSHILFGIALGLWLMNLLFQIHETAFEGERSATVETIVAGWAVEIFGTLTMNEYYKAIFMKPKGLEISYPIPVAVEYGCGVTQSAVPHRLAVQTPVVMNTARVNSLAAIVLTTRYETRELDKFMLTIFVYPAPQKLQPTMGIGSHVPKNHYDRYDHCVHPIWGSVSI
ncbi:hypothetical protein B0H13DRAFT_1851592 [Mycena leptocephala]|nr:hypothetical protein B0H13DRAFT_1851592 [Mycena leptocephala]